VKRAVQGACAALVALSGCAFGGDQEARPAGGAPKAVAATIQALDQATRRRDFGLICRRLFTSEARRRAGGGDCPRLLRSAVQEVRDPQIRIAGIRIEGDRATVRVRSSAGNQRPIADEVELVRRGRRYLISSLAG
jgi:hypothetical protein